MHSADLSIGKTLEFVLQERNREINTIGNKSSDLEIARAVIDIKANSSAFANKFKILSNNLMTALLGDKKAKV